MYTCTYTIQTNRDLAIPYQGQHRAGTCVGGSERRPCWWSSSRSRPGPTHPTRRPSGCSEQSRYEAHAATGVHNTDNNTYIRFSWNMQLTRTLINKSYAVLKSLQSLATRKWASLHNIAHLRPGLPVNIFSTFIGTMYWRYMYTKPDKQISAKQ